MLRAAGGRTKAEIEAEKVEPTATSGIGQQAADRVRKPRGAITGSFTEGESFFKKVNALAMASLSSWVPALFPTANPYNGGYRVTSKDLGRNYQEDLSISPKGIKDWGVWDVGDSHQGKRTPIDLVIEWGNKTATDAALWLCDRMGMPPEALGWRQSSQDEEAPGEAEGERPANEAALSNNLPVIQIKDGELSSLATKAEEILIAAGVPIYQRGGTLVRPIIDTVDATRGRTTKVAQLKVLDAVYLRDLLGRYAVWVRWDARSKKMVQTNPPLEIANTILARAGDWSFPAIAGVISTPTMRPDGSLLTEQGYDPATRLLLVEPPPMPPIPDQPTKDDALEALKILEGLLTEFPFVDDVAKACALSAIITPVVRGALLPTPDISLRCTN